VKAKTLFHHFSKVLGINIQRQAYMRWRESGGLRYTGGGCARQICSRISSASLIGSNMGKESQLGKKWFEATCFTMETSEGMQKRRRSTSLQDGLLDRERHWGNILPAQREHQGTNDWLG
jgi:hypothetical protein